MHLYVTLIHNYMWLKLLKQRKNKNMLYKRNIDKDKSIYCSLCKAGVNTNILKDFAVVNTKLLRFKTLIMRSRFMSNKKEQLMIDKRMDTGSQFIALNSPKNLTVVKVDGHTIWKLHEQCKKRMIISVHTYYFNPDQSYLKSSLNSTT